MENSDSLKTSDLDKHRHVPVLLISSVSSGTGVQVGETDATVPVETQTSEVHDEHMSTTSVLDSEESLEDDLELDLDITIEDKSDQQPLFIIFTCTIKSRLQQYSIPLNNLSVCLGK